MNLSRFIVAVFALLPWLVAQSNPAAAADPAAKPSLPAKADLHLYLLMGQSNMAGRGVVEAQDKVAHPRVLKFSKDKQWLPATDPLHFDKSQAGVGLGKTFGEVMADADPKITVGLIPCAFGGTPIARWQKGADLYQNAVDRAKAAMKDGTLKGVLWHQGETDSGTEKIATKYGELLTQLVTDLRTELDAGDVPFVAGQLGEFLNRGQGDKPSYWPVINSQLDALPMQLKNSAVASSKDLKHKGDSLHFDSPSFREFGKRYAAQMLKLQASNVAAKEAAASADTVITGGRVVTLDADNRVLDAIALKAGRIVATGGAEDIQKLIGPQTEVIKLNGESVVPGFIESHCHAVGVARGSLEQTYVEISSIAEMQAWIRQAAKDLPAGRWIEVPRNEITRLKERRFPTPSELDTACTTHPVLYNSVSNKYVLNSVGFERLGLTKPDSKIEGGEVLRDDSGRPLLIRGGAGAIRAQMPARPTFSNDEVREALAKLLKRYNEVGITSIFERATDPQSLTFFRELREQERLTTRVTGTFRFGAKSAEAVEKYVASLGLKPGEGDDWIKAGPLKITVDGGIHWGTTRLSEPYGPKRIGFYRLTDPEYRGEQYYSVAEMQTIFATATKLGWQMSAHVTGDEGTLRVLEAVAKAAESEPSIRSRRFTLIHSYFPSAEIVKQCRDLGVGVDTQGYLYFKDADTLAEIYGPQWAQRFLGLGDWVRAGVPVGLNADHMIGLDPDHSMNSFNPMLMVSIAVNRKTINGHVHGEHQKLSRFDALRTVTQWPAWLSFDEAKLGTLESGKLADLAILDRDILTCPAEALAQTKVRRSIVGGKSVFVANR